MLVQTLFSRPSQTTTDISAWSLLLTFKKWVHDPMILGNDQPFCKGHGDSRYGFVLGLLVWCRGLSSGFQALHPVQKVGN